MFTDKAKGKFKIWYNEFILDKFKDHHIQDIQGYPQFINLPLSMQWGVIEDFAESEGYYIYIKQITTGYSVYIDDAKFAGHHILTDYCVKKTRDEARLECIKALNELLNK